MKMSGNTVLVTGGGSGIGRALAEEFHKRSNQVVISGRRQSALDEVTKANPGMKALTVDMADKQSVAAFAAELTKLAPDLNVVLNNAGIMTPEDILAAPKYVDIAEDTIATNLLGPIRLTAALLPHLLKQKDAAVLTVSSGLAFVPLAMTPTYSATKAAIHSYSLSLRERLKDTPVQVIEIAPPYVQTTLMGERQASDPNAMPLADFIAETMQILTDNPDAKEVIVTRCEPLRYAVEQGNFDAVFTNLNAQQH